MTDPKTAGRGKRNYWWLCIPPDPDLHPDICFTKSGAMDCARDGGGTVVKVRIVTPPKTKRRKITEPTAKRGRKGK